MNSNQKPLLKRTFAILFMIVLYYTIQYATGKLAIFPHLSLPEDIKTHGNWVQLLDHHLWQMFIALLLIAIISKGNFKEWGFNFKNIDVSLRILKKFMFYFSVYFIGIGFLIQLFFVSATQLGHSFTIINIFGNIGFKGIISGLSEEILFRGLMQTYLLKYFSGIIRWRNLEIPVAGFIVTLIFTFVHVNFSLSPFEITHFYLPQLVLAFVLGIYYSIVFHKTGSLINPVLAHNFSNLTLYLSELALFIIKKV